MASKLIKLYITFLRNLVETGGFVTFPSILIVLSKDLKKILKAEKEEEEVAQKSHNAKHLNSIITKN